MACFPLYRLALLSLSGLALLPAACAQAGSPANVLLILTDDQGYSDVGFNGNPLIRTPILDELADGAIVLDNFYTQPLCSPTRAALMSGQYSMRTGVTDTEGGISILPPETVTVAEILKQNGFRTGLFGKWHLGDNAPARPQDQGFETVLTHEGGMIGMSYSPPGGRSYFDPVLLDNGVHRRFDGYSADIFTDAAIAHIKAARAEGKPFFTFLSFNTPHHPLTVGDEFAEPYREAGLSEETSRFYGMISNIDYNVGRVLETLEAEGILDDTLIIFLSDNGTSSLHQQDDLWESGLRGRKTFVYENGIRVPAIIRMPGEVRPTGRRSEVLAVEDILPTILDIEGIEASLPLDGRSFKSVLTSDSRAKGARSLFFQFQRGEEVDPLRNAAVRQGRYKLVQPVGRGREPFSEDLARFELYDVEQDPYEQRDIAQQHPDLVATLKQQYLAWLQETYSGEFRPVSTWIGSSLQNPVILTRQDWRQAGLQDGENGFHDLEVKSAGRYRLTFRWSHLLNEARDVTIRLNDDVIQREILLSEMEARIESIELGEGPLRLEAWVDIDGQASGFESIEIEKLGP